MSHASNHRETRFELVSLKQGANSFHVKCVARGVVGSAPPELDLDEVLFSEKEMKQVHDTLEMLEAKFADVHDGRQTTAAAAHEAMTKAIEAEKRLAAAQLETQRLELEAIAKRAEHDQLDQALVMRRLELAAVAAEGKADQ